jgi:hypothetical protein
MKQEECGPTAQGPGRRLKIQSVLDDAGQNSRLTQEKDESYRADERGQHKR